MNRLNKFVASFVLLFFCLFVSVSYAEIEPNVRYSGWFNYNQSSRSSVGSYSSSVISSALTDFNNGSTEELTNIMNDLISTEVISSWYVGKRTDNDYNILIMVPYGIDAELFYSSSDSKFYLCFPNVASGDYFYIMFGTTLYKNSAKSPYYPNYPTGTNFTYFSTSVKELTVPSGSSGVFTWDGESYYYKPSTEEPDTPSLPSNAEIAQAVQAFYNSDYYKNNKDFEDFIVLYNYNTRYFSFICHNFEDKFQQFIFPAGYKYKEQWWKFSLDGLGTELTSYIFNKYYWLYSTNNFGETISYDGKGSMQDLLDLNFTTMSTIVYSTNEYDVVVYSYNDNNELESQMETLPGDQYTYDENLDPTTNEYNPLENFVPTNPSQTILGDVDFDEINKTFEENKDILNIEGASWLFIANNQLINYFIGFLSLLIVFLIISRILGG